MPTVPNPAGVTAAKNPLADNPASRLSPGELLVAAAAAPKPTVVEPAKRPKPKAK